MDSDSDSDSESSTSVPASTAGILMLSLPDSFDDDGAINDNDDESSADQDVFRTPPEYALVGTSQEKTPILDLNQIADDDCDYGGVGDFGDGSGVIVAVGGCGEDGDGAVDLGRDADLVMAEAEAMEIRVSKRDSSAEASSAESWPPSKKLKISEEESETEPLSLSNVGSDFDQALEIAGNDVKSVELSSGEKNVEEYAGSESENGTAGTQPVTEESGSAFGEEEHLFQEDGEIVSTVVPLSFCSPAGSSVRRAEEGNEWSSLLEMVRLVREITGEKYNEVEKCSLLELAKRRGMTFPRM